METFMKDLKLLYRAMVMMSSNVAMAAAMGAISVYSNSMKK